MHCQAGRDIQGLWSGVNNIKGCFISWYVGACDVAYQHPAVETDAERQVDGRSDEQSPEPLQQQEHKAHLEDVGVEHHQ